jgi:hypothetical protein
MNRTLAISEQKNRLTWILGLSVICVGVLSAAPAVELADAKAKVNRRVGTYKGTVETGGTVSFRITRGRKVVGFTATGVPQRCYTAPLTDPVTQEQPKGTVTFGPPTMSLDGGGKFFHANFSGLPGRQPGPFREIRVQGKPRSATKFEGKVFLHTANGNQEVAGTEVCTTGEPEWIASKVGRKRK